METLPRHIFFPSVEVELPLHGRTIQRYTDDQLFRPLLKHVYMQCMCDSSLFLATTNNDDAKQNPRFFTNEPSARSLTSCISLTSVTASFLGYAPYSDGATLHPMQRHARHGPCCFCCRGHLPIRLKLASGMCVVRWQSRSPCTLPRNPHTYRSFHQQI